MSGIGCSGRLPVYVDVDTVHTTHGRALTFATGIKMANPELKVIMSWATATPVPSAATT